METGQTLPPSVSDIIQNEYLLTVLADKCVDEHSSENLMFLEHVRHYKGIKDSKQRLAKGKYIFEEFLRVESLFEINCNRNAVIVIEDGLLKEFKDGEDVAPKDFFDKMASESEILVKDTVRRHRKEISEKAQEEKELSSLATEIVEKTYLDEKSHIKKRASLHIKQRPMSFRLGAIDSSELETQFQGKKTSHPPDTTKATKCHSGGARSDFFSKFHLFNLLKKNKD